MNSALHFLNVLSQWAVYFAPTLVAWFRMRQGKSIVLPFGSFVLMNLALAWTVLVWLLLIANAFGYNPVPSIALRLFKILPKAEPGVAMSMAQEESSSASQRRACGQCGGAGSVACSHCQGHGSRYTQPTTAHEVAQLRTCGYCTSSGRIRCPNCGGSGQA